MQLPINAPNKIGPGIKANKLTKRSPRPWANDLSTGSTALKQQYFYLTSHETNVFYEMEAFYADYALSSEVMSLAIPTPRMSSLVCSKKMSKGYNVNWLTKRNLMNVLQTLPKLVY